MKQPYLIPMCDQTQEDFGGFVDGDIQTVKFIQMFTL